MKKIIAFLITLIVIILLPARTFAQESIPTLVNQYQCEALYIVQTPTDVHLVVKELLGYTPLPQTIDHYTRTLITEKKCRTVDTNQIIWNICGNSGNKNTICDEWKKETNLYSEELIYNLYYRKAAAANSLDWQSIPHFQKEEVPIIQEEVKQVVQSNDTEQANFILYIIAIVLLISTGIFVFIQWNKRRHPQTTLNADDYIHSNNVSLSDLMD